MNQLRDNSNKLAFYAGHESLHSAGLADEIWSGTNRIAYRGARDILEKKAYAKLSLEQRAKNPDHTINIVYP